MHKKLETRSYPKRENRVQVKLNRRWRSHQDFTATFGTGVVEDGAAVRLRIGRGRIVTI